ncbi:DUF4440 domain-containing protein [Nakamurella antarctica]|uniref:nuclear transport factor 2 family protein n=1 Tax=Nakamurella antarctica TaxID=1902245 RepID=UPI0013DDB782|nr:nuclear transport factor 2 family protein [Nakamurella antarctica]
MDHEKTITAAELELLTASTRANSARVSELLHPDFVEIGRSGHLWNRAEIVTSLAREVDHATPVLSDWAFLNLSKELIVVTYLAHTAAVESRHSSIWDIGGEQPRLRFHQGTIVPGSGSVG